MKKTSYCKCFPELDDKELDEKYALISHAIQLENKPEAKNYIDILKKNGININLYPTKKIFNEQNNIVFAFSFIQASLDAVKLPGELSRCERHNSSPSVSNAFCP